MFDVKDVSFGYGARRVLDRVSFSVASGETVALLGANGAGKTTLLQVLAGVRLPSRGEVWVDGFDAFRYPIRYRRHLGYLSERAPVEADLTVKQYLRYRALLRGEVVKKIRHRVQEAISVCSLGAVADRATGALSQGQRKRVALAEAILLRPRHLLLDDPMAGLDRPARAGVRDVLAGLASFASVIVAGHELDEFASFANRFLVLKEGRVHEAATCAEAEALLS